MMNVLEVTLLLGEGFDELIEDGTDLTLEHLQLAVLEIDNVSAHAVQETGIMGGGDNGTAVGHKVAEPLLDPCDVLHIKMTSGLVKHDHISLHQGGGAELHLHLPTTGVGGDAHGGIGGAVLTEVNLLVTETDLHHDLGDLLAGDGSRQFVDVVASINNPVNTAEIDVEDGVTVLILTDLALLDLVLDEDGLELVTLGEALNLLVGDGAHHGGLTAIVGTEETIKLITLEVKLGVVQQGQGTVGEGEDTLVELDALIILDIFLLLTGSGLLAVVVDDLDDGLGLSLREDLVQEVGTESLLPDVFTEGEGVGETGDQMGGVGEDGLESLVRGLAGDVLLHGGLEHLLGDLMGHDVHLDLTLTRGLDHGGQCALADGTGLGVGDGLGVLLQNGLEDGDEGEHLLGVLDELAHVVNDDTALTLDLLLGEVETAEEDGLHDSERGGLDVLDEDATGELLDGLGDVGLLNALHHDGEEGIKILVAVGGDARLHSLASGGLDLLLDIPHQGIDGGDELDEATADGLGGLLSQMGEGLEDGLLLGGLDTLGVEDTDEDVNNHGCGPAGGGVGDGPGGVDGGLDDLLVLVGGSLEHLGEEGDGDGLDGAARFLADGSEALVDGGGDGLVLGGIEELVEGLLLDQGVHTGEVDGFVNAAGESSGGGVNIFTSGDGRDKPEIENE